MKKRGFTLIELIAVIALLGVIMMLVTPNVIGLFNSARKSAFYDEVLNVYNHAPTTYIYNSSNGDYTKRFCKGKDATTKELEIEDKSDFYYDITVNNYGEVLSMKIANKNFGINVSSEDGLSKKEISKDKVSDSFNIYCNGEVEEPPQESLTCIITKTNRSCRIYSFNYKRTGENA